MDENAKVKKIYNSTGFPLEDGICNELKSDERLKVHQEVPYSIDFYNLRSTIDLIAISGINKGKESGWDFIFPIECKKSSKGEGIWVFKRKLEKTPIVYDTLLNKNNLAYVYKKMVSIDPMPIYNNYFQCSDITEKNISLSKNQTENAYKAMLSPNQMASSIIMRHKLLTEHSWRSNFIILPLVCTNSKLMTIDYSPKDVDMATGEISESESEVKEVDYLFYQFPMGYGVSPLPVDDYPEFRLTIVVNSKSIGKAIDLILKSKVEYLPTPPEVLKT